VTIWIGLLLTACVIAVLALTSWRRRVQMAELGTVSAQWLSEHRGYDRHYSDR
jgi:Tfp pilus assembly protein PilE